MEQQIGGGRGSGSGTVSGADRRSRRILGRAGRRRDRETSNHEETVMESSIIGLFGAVGTMAFFAFLAFAVWLDYRKKKDDRDAAHGERMKALELGYAPLDAEIERAKAYAGAAWAAGLIGLLVPIVLASLTVVG